jgi:HEAT repeat protein
LIALLNDKQEIVALRTAAAEALAKCDNDASRAALKAAAKDSNLSVREAAEHSFASLPDDTWLEEAYDVRGASQP